MNKKKIILRADGNSDIGLGHVYRSLAIAENLKNDFEIFFAIQEPDNAIKDIWIGTAQIIALPKTNNFEGEAKQLLELSEELFCDMIVLDGYNFDTQYQQKLKRGTAKLVCIDDYAPFHYVADAVINHADGLSQDAISAESYTKKYLGFEYAMIRRQFTDLYVRSREINEISSAFICFGGADAENNTLKVCSAVVDANVFNHINVIAGSSYLHINALKTYASKHKEISIYYNLTATDLINVMTLSEIAFVPASTIALECYAAHLILFTGTTADNQKYIYKGLLEKPHVYALGDINKATETEIINSIRSFTNHFQGCNFNGEQQRHHLPQVFLSLI